ncbi:MAG: tRNA pseudouridine32 synthase/23S rRNA pseudouridine746 synthase [Phycisphaerales bacterium]
MPNPIEFGPVARWDYAPPADGPGVIFEEFYEREQKNGQVVPGGYVVIDKPSGLLAVPGLGEGKDDCARSRVQALYPFASGPMTVHRLDVATSGVLVLALDAATHRNFSLQFERRKVSKRYLGIVQGHVRGESGSIHTPMRKDMDRAPTQLVDFKLGKPSETKWRVLARETLHGEPVTRIELLPETGRTHQLRVHCAEPRPGAVRVVGEAGWEFANGNGRGLGAPILGDEMYAGPNPKPETDRLMLHAWSLTFSHPVHGKMMSVCARAPF